MKNSTTILALFGILSLTACTGEVLSPVSTPAVTKNSSETKNVTPKSADLNKEESKGTGQKEDWVYIQNDDLRVGLLRSHGGAIAHLSRRSSKPNSGFNVFDYYDHGRLVQQSFYGEKDGSLWGDKPWHYNPVQGGDCRGVAAKVVEFRATKTSAYVKTIPRHWASGKLLEECIMEQWVELDGPIVRVRYKFVYNGQMIHKPRPQEMPAVFIASKLDTLVRYTGDKPWTGAPLTRHSPGWPNEDIILSESWAAYVGSDEKGVGIFVPDTFEATCYRFGNGLGECSYIAPLRTFALTPKLSVSYTAILALGDVKTIRERFTHLHNKEK